MNNNTNNKEDYFKSDEFLEYLHDLILKAAVRKRAALSEQKNEPTV